MLKPSRVRGFLAFRFLSEGETQWFFSAGREFGLWYLTAHGLGLYFGIIGPFTFTLRRSEA